MVANGGNTTDISEYTAGTGNVLIIKPPLQIALLVVFDFITGTNPYY